ncbi:Hypothetical Protein FCC1311_113592 [Hondaea fermentalgiana]|uniref:Uncharacterized protein n=1 Tax=Hondaea fermentalgiana TaxID=2315210 RepID=A0A2R5GWC0_9STRA|nr:Hypothetical Protein FCC1311_113592 [Hondaea fermentalgiana]|eukprot:GBG35136.1 Hypothetical Protein FCC1311_113592 [Hondaea fermentalgiana]
MGSVTWQRARRDSADLFEFGVLTDPTFRRRKFNTSDADFALRFALISRHVGFLSWGSRRVRLTKREAWTLPRVVLQVDKAILIRWYKEACTKSGRKAFLDSIMYEILKTIINSNQKLLTSVDYVVVSLLNDTTRNLRHLVARFACTEIERTCFDGYIDHARHLLKVKAFDHMRKADGYCDTYNICYALAPPENPSVRLSDGEEYTPSCGACKFPYWAFAQLTSLLQRNTDMIGEKDKLDALQYISDVETKCVKPLGVLLRRLPLTRACKE